MDFCSNDYKSGGVGMGIKRDIYIVISGNNPFRRQMLGEIIYCVKSRRGDQRGGKHCDFSTTKSKGTKF